MRSEKSGSNVRRFAALTAVVAAALLTLVSAAPALAGTPPNRLDDNRGDFLVQTAVNSFVELPPLLPFFFPTPFLLPPPFGPLTPRVLENPSIHNVFWDSDWNDHHSGAFTTDSIDAMTQKLVDSNFFDFAGQYDVGHASFDGSDTSGGIFNPCSSAPGSTTNFLDILASSSARRRWRRRECRRRPRGRSAATTSTSSTSRRGRRSTTSGSTTAATASARTTSWARR